MAQPRVFWFSTSTVLHFIGSAKQRNRREIVLHRTSSTVPYNYGTVRAAPWRGRGGGYRSKVC